jgi:hypothetical protein
MQVNLQNTNRVPLQQANILFSFDHVIKEPDSYILRKISTVYQKKFEKYIDWKYIVSLDDKSLLNSLVNREDPNVLKWISTQEFDYEKNYNFLLNAWKDMYMNSPDLLGKLYIRNYLKSYCIDNLYIWNETDDIRQRYELTSSFGKSKIQYVTGPLHKVLDEIKVNIVYDYSAKRIAELLEDYPHGEILFGIASYGFNFEKEGLMKLKYGLNTINNVTTFQIVEPDNVSEFKG